MQKKIIFVSNASPLLGRPVPMTGAIFSWFRGRNYIQALDDYLKKQWSSWSVEQDTSEADIDIIKEYADIIICAPGLNWQFFTNDFNKKNVIYLTTMEYATNNFYRVCQLMKSIQEERGNI